MKCKNIPHMRKRKDFVTANKYAAIKIMPGIIMQRQNRNDQKLPRQGITVTQKIGNAVKRNYVRRKIRQAAKQILPEIAQKGCDYVIIGRAYTENRNFEKLKNDIQFAAQYLNQNPQGDPVKMGKRKGKNK